MRKLLFVLICSGIYLCKGTPIATSSKDVSDFTIEKTWDGKPLLDNEQIKFSLHAVPKSRDIIWRIDAPFYDDPAPAGKPGEPFLGLWDYEVVEIFFLNDEDQYLEVEIGPQGQHIVLLLNGQRNTIRHSLPLQVQTEIKGSRWRANATIPGDYFPPQVTKLNAYAIHGTGEERKYSALYPADGTTSAPDFHNLSFFQPFDITEVNPRHQNYKDLSQLWKDSIEGIFKYEISRQWNNFRSNIPPTEASLQGFQGGVEINFTMPLNDASYPAESFVSIFENEEGETVKFQFFVDGNYFVEFFNSRRNKLDVDEEELTVDYRVDDKHSRVVKGSALVPPSYFPPGVTLMNLYSLFGVETMLAMTLRPIQFKSGSDFRPNLSNMEHFTAIDFDLLVESNDDYSPLWRKLSNLPPVLKNEKEDILETEDVTESDVTTATAEVTSSPDDSMNLVEEDTPSSVPEQEEEEERPEVATEEVQYNDNTPHFNKPLALMESSRDSEPASKREIFPTKSEQDEFADKISHTSKTDRMNENKAPAKELPTEPSSGDSNSYFTDPTTEGYSTVTELLQSVTETEGSLTLETVNEQPLSMRKGNPPKRKDEKILQGSENSGKTEKKDELTTLTSLPEDIESAPSNDIVDTVEVSTLTPTEEATLPEEFPHYDEDDSSVGMQEEDNSLMKKDQELESAGQREVHPRRYEENSDKNEIPITFKITFESKERIQNKGEIPLPIDVPITPEIPPPLPQDGLAEDYSLLDEISDDLGGIEELLPPAHPICFEEGLVPDFYRCQVFYECVLENGKWEVYNWRCKRGSYYDPVKVACIRGYC